VLLKGKRACGARPRCYLALQVSFSFGWLRFTPSKRAVSRRRPVRTSTGRGVWSMGENAGIKARPDFRKHFWSGLHRPPRQRL